MLQACNFIKKEPESEMVYKIFRATFFIEHLSWPKAINFLWQKSSMILAGLDPKNASAHKFLLKDFLIKLHLVKTKITLNSYF